MFRSKTGETPPFADGKPLSRHAFNHLGMALTSLRRSFYQFIGAIAGIIGRIVVLVRPTSIIVVGII